MSDKDNSDSTGLNPSDTKHPISFNEAMCLLEKGLIGRKTCLDLVGIDAKKTIDEIEKDKKKYEVEDKKKYEASWKFDQMEHARRNAEVLLKYIELLNAREDFSDIMREALLKNLKIISEIDKLS